MESVNGLEFKANLLHARQTHDGLHNSGKALD
jgi:hypothetical protein